MSTAELKDHINDLLGATKDSKVLKIIYEILMAHEDAGNLKLSASQKKELSHRIKKHKSGKSPSLAWGEVKQFARTGK